MKPDGHKQVAEQAGIWRLKKALESYGNLVNVYPSGLDAFYLGNWLADHSQFRDPKGFIPNIFGADDISDLHKSLLSLGQSFASTLEDFLLTMVLDIVNILPTKEKEKRDNWVAEFFYEVSSCIDMMFQVYRNELVKPLGSFFSTGTVDNFLKSLIRYKAYTKFVYPEEGKSQPKIDYAVFSKIFERHYTQYLPHEHLDRPLSSQTIPEHTKKKSVSDILYADSIDTDKFIYRYMEDAIKIVAGQLHELDKEWAKPIFADRPPIDQSNDEWHIRLSDLGRSLHLVEDFFAHSNFTEAMVMGKSSEEIRKFFYNGPLLKKALSGKPISGHEQKEINDSIDNVKKVMKRQKKYSFAAAENAYMLNINLPYDESIVTGYFDGEDAKVAVLEAIIDLLKKSKDSPDSFLDILLENILEDLLGYEMKSINSIVDLLSKNSLQSETDKFQEYLRIKKNERLSKIKNNVILKEDVLLIVTTLFEAVIVAAKILIVFIYLVKLIKKRAEDIEEIEKMIGTAGWSARTTFMDWFKKIFIKTIIKYLTNRMLKSGIQVLDDNYDPLDILLEAMGKNRIGSHSLLAKDLPQEPLYQEMFNCAKTVHYFIIDAMCRWSDDKWKNNKHNPEWIDWEDLIFNFLRHPKKMSATTKVVKSDVYAVYSYLTKGDEAFESIFNDLVVNKQEFSIDYLLQINNIPISYLKGVSGGTPLDHSALRNFLLATNKASTANNHNYNLKPGIEINIPYLSSINLELPDKTVWYDNIVKLDAKAWAEFFEIFMTERKNYYDNSKTANSLYTYKFLSDDECLKKINMYKELKIKLTKAYNKKT